MNNKKINIAIIGTRGIPNYYGGFEQFAEYLSVRLVENGHKVSVYNSHKHPYQDSEFNGVTIIHCKDPEHKIGTAGQFLYDFNCIRDSRKRKFDIILQLGYTSSSVWSRLFPKKTILITNMDGLEWKRTKFSKKVQRFLKYAESLAVKHSDYLISDSIGIQQYIKEKYIKDSSYIPYGAEVFTKFNSNLIKSYNISSYKYDMLIARLEPENSIETILDGVAKSNSNLPFLVIGNNETKFGEYLKHKFDEIKNIIFIGGLYDQEILNNLRFYSRFYFHGHTVGGTNPSLLEAMACSSLICSHDNVFNKSILGEDAYFFNTKNDVAELLNNETNRNESWIQNNLNKINSIYGWTKITEQYELLFKEALK